MPPVCRKCRAKVQFPLIIIMQNLMQIMLSIMQAACTVLEILQSSQNQFFLLDQLHDSLSVIPFLATAAWRAGSPAPRSCWTYPGRSDWFHNVVLKLWDERLWLENFRMSRQTLFEIADELRPYLLRQDTVMRSAIPVEERIAIGVYYLSHKSCYRKLADIFSKGISSIASVVIEFCLAMEHKLLHKEVKLTDYHKVIAGFQRLGFPNCIGAIDCTHIPIICPKVQQAQYFNHKSFHSVVLQAACDADGVFFSILAGHPGVAHDAQVFRSSLLCKQMEAGTFVPGNPLMHYGGVSIPPVLIADGAYPLCRWLMKPYPNPITERERNFNKVFNRCRNVVERAFRRLKSRFRRLSDRMAVHVQNINSVIAAAVILHNICERKNHILPEGEGDSTSNEDFENDVPVVEDAGRVEGEGESVRNALADYIYNHNNV
ncbi:hypothetical protein JRQ81_012101 [Phrynocephalus forsythii]|uniref:DDE Tnp4 domain-containing protein n=1 Tax=Phrynocephalus forsythii TaxID=171643 RepID=A0A9Q0X5A0_9SAUR|nr:hypothetical protein JRQ81_012101 [Phrynocephalus forsythii]